METAIAQALAVDESPAVDLSSGARRDFVALLQLVAFGERIATECADWQATATPDRRARRFFRAQARHERFHELLFSSAARWLQPGESPSARPLGVLQRYQEQLNSAMRGGDWLEVLVGQQLVLESIGEVVLSRLDKTMSRHQAGMGRVRSMVLRQEQAHHSYGVKLLDAELSAARTDADDLQRLAVPYLDLADELLTTVSPLLASLGADAEQYREEFWSHLPAWAAEA